MGVEEVREEHGNIRVTGNVDDNISDVGRPTFHERRDRKAF